MTNLVGGVLNLGLRPRATAGSVITGRVRNKGCDPVSVLLVLFKSAQVPGYSATHIPLLGLVGVRVGDHSRFILEPVSRFGGGLVNDHDWSILIPVGGLGRMNVVHELFIDPGLRLEVLGVICTLVWYVRALANYRSPWEG